jgi:hypothetical protein
MLSNLGHRGPESEKQIQSDLANLMVVHDGAACPVDPRALVRVLHRDGQETTDVASEYVWPHLGKAFDIVAYRTIETWQARH